MSEEVDKRLSNWIAGQMPDLRVCLGPPQAKSAGRGIGLYLLELMQSPMPSALRRTPLQLMLRYLVTTWSDNPEDAHDMLVQLAFAAMESTTFQLEMESVPLSIWSAFGIPPQPSFVLRIPVQRERPEPDTALVREPLRVQTSPMVSFHGVLLGPGDLPLANCVVEVPSLNLSTTTDHKGRFSFVGLPAQGAKKLLVKAKGHVLPVNSDVNYPDSTAPLVIHFSPLEG